MCSEMSGLLSADSVGFVKAELNKINEPQSREKNLEQLQSLGGVTGVAELLKTDISKGITQQEASQRRKVFGCNSLPSNPRKTWFQLFIGSFDDETLQILIAAALVSLAVGIYDDPATGYVEGLAILTAVLVVSVVTATNDYQKETQFRALNKANEDVQVVLIRDGEHVQVPVQDIVIGDLVCIDTGDSIPCDGVLVTSDSLEIDESALTGEPIDVDKDLVKDPFVLSGCIATAGTATFIATAVGRDSQWGVIKAHLEKEQDQTPLQEKLDHMAEQIGNIGMVAAAATMIAMICIKIFVKPTYLDEVSLFAHALEAFIIGVTIVVVAVPEGLPLAVTIALAYSTKKMLADKNLIRHLAACETMGNATNICSDKTGTLTENRMTVVKGVFANKEYGDTSPESSVVCDISKDASEIILECIATCSTARILAPEQGASNSRPQVVGNKTEAALLLLAQSNFFGNDDYSSRRAEANFGKADGSRIFPFSSLRKRMSVLVNKDGDSDWTLYHKGAGEIVLKDCTYYLDENGSEREITDSKRKELEKTISSYASQALRCVALAHRLNIQNVIDPKSATESDCESKCENHLVLDALVGIVDPLRADVFEAVQICQNAGIIVRMVTGDNLETANAIAKQAGILTEGKPGYFCMNSISICKLYFSNHGI